MMWNGCSEMGFPMMIGGGLLMLLFWGLVIWLVIYLIRRFSDNHTSNNSAIDLLRQRYSKGEIDTEEYQERLNKLKDTSK